MCDCSFIHLDFHFLNMQKYANILIRFHVFKQVNREMRRYCVYFETKCILTTINCKTGINNF